MYETYKGAEMPFRHVILSLVLQISVSLTLGQIEIDEVDLRDLSKCPPGAEAFGAEIQSFIEARDLRGLMGLVVGELDNGPRKITTKSATFSDFFDDQWRNTILASRPCTKMGWRGYMIGPGTIWFSEQADDPTLSIFAIGGAKEISTDTKLADTRWLQGNIVLTPDCFSYIWMSSDNYEAYQDRFHISEDRFYDEPGQYFGREINSFEPLTVWDGYQLTLTPMLSQCGIAVSDVHNTDRYRFGPHNRVEDTCAHQSEDCAPRYYEIIRFLPTDLCSSVAPHIAGTCLSLAVVEHGDLVLEMSGMELNRLYGSIGPQTYYALYALIDFDGQNKVIAPLINFTNENIALNYIDINSK